MSSSNRFPKSQIFKWTWQTFKLCRGDGEVYFRRSDGTFLNILYQISLRWSYQHFGKSLTTEWIFPLSALLPIRWHVINMVLNVLVLSIYEASTSKSFVRVNRKYYRRAQHWKNVKQRNPFAFFYSWEDIFFLQICYFNKLSQQNRILISRYSWGEGLITSQHSLLEGEGDW